MIGEIAVHLTEEKEKAIGEIDQLKRSMIEDVKNEKNKIIRDLQANAPTYLRKSFTWAGVGFLILVGLTLLVPWLQLWTRPHLDKYVADSVDKHLLTSFEVPATLLPDAVKDLNKRVDDLNAKIDRLGSTSQKKK
jgi:hypothetical protein